MPHVPLSLPHCVGLCLMPYSDTERLQNVFLTWNAQCLLQHFGRPTYWLEPDEAPVHIPVLGIVLWNSSTKKSNSNTLSLTKIQFYINSLHLQHVCLKLEILSYIPQKMNFCVFTLLPKSIWYYWNWLQYNLYEQAYTLEWSVYTLSSLTVE